jgi:hypothetical protein
MADVTEAYGAARELLDRAEEDAARIRHDADRYRQQREQEAELLVAKARRLLAVAEQKAVVIGQTPAEAQVIDLDDPPDPARGGRGSSAVGTEDAGSPTGLDRMLMSAISRAFEGSFTFGP